MFLPLHPQLHTCMPHSCLSSRCGEGHSYPCQGQSRLQCQILSYPPSPSILALPEVTAPSGFVLYLVLGTFLLAHMHDRISPFGLDCRPCTLR